MTKQVEVNTEKVFTKKERRFLELFTKECSGTLNSDERIEFSKLMTEKSVANNEGRRKDKIAFATQSENAEKEAKKVLRIAIESINKIYLDAGLTPTTKNKSIKIAYSTRCNVKPTAKNIEIKLISHAKTTSDKKALENKEKAKILKAKIKSEDEIELQQFRESKALKIAKSEAKKKAKLSELSKS